MGRRQRGDDGVAKSAKETVNIEPADPELEEITIEVRSPSVVVSVRVDSDTARQLHKLANRRGVRVSDVLRDAAVEYARTGWLEAEGGIQVTGPDIRVSVGRRGTNSEGGSRAEVKNNPGWGRPIQTGIPVRMG
jgi:hypothetical protein